MESTSLMAPGSMDGTFDGVSYFQARPNHGIMVPLKSGQVTFESEADVDDEFVVVPTVWLFEMALLTHLPDRRCFVPITRYRDREQGVEECACGWREKEASCPARLPIVVVSRAIRVRPAALGARHAALQHV